MQSDFKARIAASLEYRIGLVDIPIETKKFIWAHFNFLLFTTIPGVFINTFFFRQDGKLSTVSVYNAICVFGSAVTMHISSRISLKKSPVYILKIGVVLFNIFYVALLLLQGNAVRYMILLGILNAVACGFYWQGYNELVKLTTTERIFDRTVSLIGMAGSVVNLVVPVFSGMIISSFTGRIGYTIIFAVSLGFSVYTAYIAAQIGNVKIHGNSNLAGVYRCIFTNKKIFAVFAAEFFRGIKNIAYPLFLSVIFFKMTANEAILGANTTLCGLTAVFSFVIAGRYIRPNNRLKCILLSSLISAAASLPLLFFTNPVILFILAVVNAFISAFLDNPAVGIFYGVFSETDGNITFAQIMSVREIFFAAGRVIGLVMLVLFSYSSMMLALFAIIVNCTTLFTWLLFKHNSNICVNQPDDAVIT